jgi:putative ABC transport system permease protein
MRWIYKLPLRLRSLFRKKRVEQELGDELSFHLEKLIEENVAKGMSAEEARYAALREFGGIEQMKEECRDSWGVRIISELGQDIRYGLRQLQRNPGFTAVAVLMLALGIGANTAIFSVVNGLFLRGLAVRSPGELVSMGFQQGKTAIPVFSYPDLKDIGDQAGSLMEVLGYKFGIDGLSEGGHADRIITNYVTGNYFSVLGVKPALGRLILPSEGLPGHSDSIIVLGYAYWKSRFGGDPHVIGKRVQIDGERVTIVGVAPRGFHGPLKEVDIQAFMPLNMVRLSFGFPLQNRDARGVFALGRLKPGVTLAEAQAALNVIANRLAQKYPTTDARAGIHVYPQVDAALTPMPQPGMYQKELAVMALFLTLAALVLLLACVNVANILLVRATAREHEMTVRAALGAPGGRLVRQLLTESLLLALFGCAAGVLVGAWASSALSLIYIHMGLPISLNFGLDWNVLGYSAVAALLAGMIVGILPALRASRANPGAALHEGGRTTSARHNRLRNVLVVAQVAGSIVILTVAGLFTRSLLKARQMGLGFNSSHLTNFAMDPHEIGYNEARGKEFYKNLLERVRALPGVKSAALAFTYPSNGVYINASSVYVEGHLPPKGEPPPTIYVNNVSPDYFKTLGIPIVEGRPFADTDTAKAQGVAVINETMARQFWPKEDPIGKQFTLGSATGKAVEVVGVARDSKYYDLFSKPIPYFYRCLDQEYISIQTLQVRSMLPPATLDRQVERQIHELAPGLPVFDVQTMKQALEEGGFYQFRLSAYFAAALGLLGLILATVGVYGVTSYSTSQRSREIGIRMALGARPGDIWRSVFRQGLVIVGMGAVAGVVIALGLTRVMSHMLFGVTASDPVTYLGATILIAAVTLLACYIPARRATKVDPMVALRYE